MADGSVIFSIGADDKEAQAKLNRLRKDIENTQKALDKNSTAHSGIAAQLQTAREEAEKTAQEIQKLQAQYQENAGVLSGRTGNIDATEFEARKQAQAEITYQLKQQEALYAKQTAAVTSLEAKEQDLSGKIEMQTAQLGQQKEEAGEIERRFAQASSSTLPALSGKIDDVSRSIKKATRNILKWGFGIRSAFILVRRLRSAIKEGIKSFAEQDEQTKANLNGLKTSLSTLKVAWGAAFAPIINAVAPMLQSLIDKLIEAANAVQAFFAALSGAGSFRRVVKNNDALADSYGGAGGAAADAKKQIMGFDELNKLNAAGGGGGGGGADKAWDIVEEEIEDYGDSLLGKIVLSLQDIIFDTSGWNGEKFAELIVAGLSGLLGWFLAASLHLGAGGTILLTLGGIVLGLALDGLIFDHDKKLSKREIIDLISLALTALTGGIIGFGIGKGFKGAAIGATLAIGVWLSVKDALVKNDASVKSGDIGRDIINVLLGGVAGFILGKGWAGAAIGVTIALGITLVMRRMRLEADALDRFNETLLGQTITKLREKVEDLLTQEADLKVHIKSITGEIDSSTQADLAQAKTLIDSIFTLDEKENLTSTEAELLQEQIKLLNSLGLDGLTLQFDEVSGHVVQTRGEVESLYNEIVKQYQLEAMHQAYVSAYQAEFEATRQVTQANEMAREAQDKYAEAVSNVSQKEDALAEARQKLNQAKVDLDTDAINEYTQAVKDCEAALLEAEQGKIAAEEALTVSAEAVANAKQNYEDAYATLDDIIDKYAQLAGDANKAGGDITEGLATGMKENSHATDAATEESDAILKAIHDTLEINSPSRATREDGEFLMEGLALGIESKSQRVINAIRQIMDTVKADVHNTVLEISRMWQSDWGKPHILIPIFRLFGSFNFQTGQVPQIDVAGWRWLAKGGILDKATLIGAGEAGKEAIVPLERNTEWIDMVANGLLDRLSRSPVANGSLVPPRALNGSMFSDADIDRLARGIATAFGNSEYSDGQSIKLYLDGRQIAETVTKHQRRLERGYA